LEVSGRLAFTPPPVVEPQRPTIAERIGGTSIPNWVRRGMYGAGVPDRDRSVLDPPDPYRSSGRGWFARRVNSGARGAATSLQRAGAVPATGAALDFLAPPAVASGGHAFAVVAQPSGPAVGEAGDDCSRLRAGSAARVSSPLK
jgi:hypothetical protein